MRRDVGILAGVAELGPGRVQAVELGGERAFAGGEEARDGGGVGLADGLAVPACAGGVDLAKGLLVGLAGPLEGGGEGVFVDFVVVVDEGGGAGGGVFVVGGRGELVGVPCRLLRCCCSAALY